MSGLGEEMHSLMTKLFPICRSITGSGYQESLDILRKIFHLRRLISPRGQIVSTGRYPTNGTLRMLTLLHLKARRLLILKITTYT